MWVMSPLHNWLERILTRIPKASRLTLDFGMNSVDVGKGQQGFVTVPPGRPTLPDSPSTTAG